MRRSDKAINKITLALYSFAAGAVTLAAGSWAIYSQWRSGNLRLSPYVIISCVMILLGIIALILATWYFRKAYSATRKR